ncbi:MAG: PilN domain-containing protein [Sterolibacterium sp.]|jgi:hypothetical protein
MSQQINLLNPAFRKVFDWLTATPLAIATCVLVVVLGGATAWASVRADKQEHAASERAKALKDAQDRLVAMGKLIADSKPNAELANELSDAVALLRSREEIIKVLDGGVIGSTTGFAEFLRGFARQTPNGLWLTGFTIGAAGSEMEIRGRMTNPAALPEYIRRLKTEPVFRGRGFAALTIQRPAAGKDLKSLETLLDATGKPANPAAAATKDAQPKFVEFVLTPQPPDPFASLATMAAIPRPAPSTTPQKQEFVDSVLTPKTENLGKAAMEELKKGSDETTKAHADALKKLQELMPSEKKP